MAFLTREIVRPYFKYDIKKDGYGMWMVGTIGSGAAAGALMAIMFQPFTYCTTRLQADVLSAPNATSRLFGGSIDLMKQTIRSDGFFALYRGVLPCLNGVYHAFS
jgi:hypothetical protein